MGVLNKFMKAWHRVEESSCHQEVSKHICCQGYNHHPSGSALEMAGNIPQGERVALQAPLTPIRPVLIAHQPKRLVQMASSVIWDVVCTRARARTHMHAECLPLIPLPSHSKSQGLASCFPVEREISDSEEAVFNFFKNIVYTNRVKKSSKDTKANLSFESLNTHISMQFLVTPLQELNSAGSVQTLLLF